LKALGIAAALFVGHCLINGTLAYAHERSGFLLTHAPTRAYRACLYAAWVEDNCRIRSGRLGESFDRVYATCIAKTAAIFPLDRRRFWYNNNEYCWNAARALGR
jgi:hypothetical protein